MFVTTITERACLAVLLLGLGACVPQGDPALSRDGFEDDFERGEIGEMYRNTGGSYRIEDGQLRIRGARNKPLWLERALPRDVRVELDVRSESQTGDIKIELFGDGHSKAETTSYTATGYVVIFGGWNNSKNVLARLDEHGEDRVVGRPMKVEKGHTYHMKVERKDGRIAVWIDDELLMEMQDPEPLSGHGHDHFAFNNWQSDLWFDNLKVTPL